jgi:hypothetical protein
MPKTQRNALTKHYSGKFGRQFILRTKGDLSVMTELPKSRNLSEAALEKQKEIQKQFRAAAVYGRKAMENPELKAAYAAKVQGNQSPYNVAFRDAFVAPELADLQLDEYTGEAGQPITVEAMDDFKVTSVKFKIFGADGQLLESGDAVETDNGTDWVYTTQVANPTLRGTRILITAEDIPKNKAKLETTL